VIELQQNPDILASVAARTENRPFTVGFAAETNNVSDYAQDKLKRKNLDMIVANDVSAAGIGFNSDRNAVEVFWGGGSQHFDARSKELASDLLNLIEERSRA